MEEKNSLNESVDPAWLSTTVKRIVRIKKMLESFFQEHLSIYVPDSTMLGTEDNLHSVLSSALATHIQDKWMQTETDRQMLRWWEE